MEIYQNTIILLVIFITYYFKIVAQKCKIYSGNVKQNEFLRKFCTLKEVYYPTIFYFNGVLQTIFGLKKRLKTRLSYTRQLFQLKDGGEIALDFIQPSQLNEQDKSDILVIILPGLASSSQTPYVQTLVISSIRAGASVVVVNNRGFGGIALKTPRTFCGTYCDDLEEVLDYLTTKFPEKRRIAVGTSFGGIVLSHYMATLAEEAKENLTSAILISTVWDAHVAATSIETPVNKYFVNFPLTDSLKSNLKKNRKILETKWDLDKTLLQIQTGRDFDSYFTAPQFNYENCKEYYDEMNLAPKIKYFSIPVFGFCAADDPFQPGTTLPYKEAKEKESNLALIVTARGGHLGFLEGFLPTSRPTHFVERFLHEFLTLI